MGGRGGVLPPRHMRSHSCQDPIKIRSLPAVSCTSLVPQDHHKTGLQPVFQELLKSLVKCDYPFPFHDEHMLTNDTSGEKECDGYLCISSEAYEGKEMMKATQEMVSRNGHRPVFNLGCMMPLGYGTEEANKSISSIETAGGRDPVLGFLDRAQKKHGEKSVIYISFGTVFP
jgi:hypothetical protein